MKIIFCFSGQGSHYYQMGKGLMQAGKIFLQCMERLDEIAKSRIGKSIITEIYSNSMGKSSGFDKTIYTHPAIFMVEYAAAAVLQEMGILPDLVLGTSLGEFTAAAVAGVLSAEDALLAVIKQAEVLTENCEAGGMVAVLEKPVLYNTEPALYECSTLAGINYSEHFVLSGSSPCIKQILQYLKDKGITFFNLPVSHPFHSHLIDAAEQKYRDAVKDLKFRQPRIPLVSCCYGQILNQVPDNFFWDVVRKPIAFSETMQMLETKESYYYIDAGPSGTLAAFIKYCLKGGSPSQAYVTLNQFGTELTNLEKLKTLIGIQQGGRNPVNTNQNKLSMQKELIMNAFVFPGQGSQKKGMGENLFDRFADYTKKADDILGYSIKELCLADPRNTLGQTQFTQPALFVVSALSYLAQVEDPQTRPDYTAGHSLGEYAALFAAGVFDFETGLKIVKERGRLMSQASGGGMAAVIGLSDEQVKEILLKNNLAAIDIANYNSPGQVVISGLKVDIEKARSCFESGGARMYMPLPVSGAFHSRYMEAAAAEFSSFIRGFDLKMPVIPVISNVTARPYKKSELYSNLIKQITHSVRWTDSIRYLMGKGKMEYKELGCGNVLAKLIAKIQQEAAPLVVEEEAADEAAGNELADNEAPGNKVLTGKEETPAATVGTTAGVTTVMGKAGARAGMITAENLGDAEFKRDYKLKYAYISGAMYKGIASPQLVVRMGKAGFMGFLGTGGMSVRWIEDAVLKIQKELVNGEAYGVNLLCNLNTPEVEEQTVDICLKYGAANLEAAAYMQVTPALVKYRLKGLKQAAGGGVEIRHRIIGKVSRPEVAAAFLAPAPERIVAKLREQGKVTAEEAALAQQVAMADDICVEADSGGHTDMGVAYTLMPALTRLRDEMMAQYKYRRRIRVGAAGGIGTPESAAAAFILGADFIVTGSINQCTVEAGMSDAVKDMLQGINVQDTGYAPAGDMFELGARIQVMRKGVFFPARANKLYNLYVQYNSLDEIDAKTREQLEDKYFKRSFDDIWKDTVAFFRNTDPAQIERAEKSPKYKMALVFRWYFGFSTKWAVEGDVSRKVDFQVQCGPALGAFNQWVKGTNLEDWRSRHVDEIGGKLFRATADLLNERFRQLTSS